MGVRRLDRDQARQLAVRAQLLDATRPTDLVDLVDHLTLLQVDPTAAIAPNADLVAWSRLGASYQPADMIRALEDRSLFELRRGGLHWAFPAFVAQRLLDYSPS